jgi:hypothetical protein
MDDKYKYNKKGSFIKTSLNTIKQDVRCSKYTYFIFWYER